MLDIRTVALAPAFVPFTEGWELQRRIHAEVVAGSAPDTLLLLEHEPVFTAGARTARSERPIDGTPVVDVDRGGKITWHGPGQLVGYPIVRLPEPVDVVAHVRRLEGVLIDVLRGFGVEGRRIDGRSGVWVRTGLEDAKIAAIGVRVQRGVTMHGFALNCDNSLEPFSQIIPCGISDAGVTTISALVGHDVDPASVVASVASAFRNEYEREEAA